MVTMGCCCSKLSFLLCPESQFSSDCEWQAKHTLHRRCPAPLPLYFVRGLFCWTLNGNIFSLLLEMWIPSEVPVGFFFWCHYFIITSKILFSYWSLLDNIAGLRHITDQFLHSTKKGHVFHANSINYNFHFQKLLLLPSNNIWRSFLTLYTYQNPKKEEEK